MSDLSREAARALACLDLTNLDADCDTAAIDRLVARAQTPHGAVAAVCVWPAFVAQAAAALAGTGIRVATVVNFPRGEDDLMSVRTLTREALEDGADEIDLVVPWRRLVAGHPEDIAPTVLEIRDICGPRTLKTILETGELKDPALIRRAADEALAGGADFLKTSTGKVAVNATLEAAAILLAAIREAGRSSGRAQGRAQGRDVGLKPAGGVRTTAEAAAYLDLCDREMGPGWAGPARFRIGASGLLDALLATLDGTAVPAAGAAY